MSRAAVMAGVALLLTCGVHLAHAQAPKKVKITIPVIAHSMTPVFIAQNKSFFTEEKIDIDVTSTNGGGPDIRALIAGEVDFSFTTGDNVILAQQEGKKLVMHNCIHFGSQFVDTGVYFYFGALCQAGTGGNQITVRIAHHHIFRFHDREYCLYAQVRVRLH